MSTTQNTPPTPHPETAPTTVVGASTGSISVVGWEPGKRPAAEHNNQRLLPIFLGLMVAMLLSALDQTIFSTALPTIVGDLDGVHQMQWVITGYILASTVMMPVYGKIGDQVGRKPVLLVAIALFMAGSTVSGLATNIDWMITGRVIQGLGGGGLMILSQTVIADIVPPRDRGRYMGLIGGVFALASVAGPLLGGWLTTGPGWRWAFWINIPLGLLAFGLFAFLLKLPRPENKVKVDFAGMITLGAATVALILAATWGGSEFDWNSWQILSLFGAVVVLSVVFVLIERKAAQPVLPLSLFRNRSFVLTMSAGLFMGIAMFGALGYMPTYLQMVHGATATESGLLMIPMMGAMLITSIVSGQIVSRTGRYKFFPVVGMVIIGVALVMLGQLSVDLPVWRVCLALGVLGLGLGMTMQILVLIVQNVFSPVMVGTATAGNNFFRQVGATLGSAVVGSLFASRLMDLLDDRMPAGAMASAGGTDASAGFTPELVHTLPEQIQSIVVGAYNDALIPIYIWLVPFVVIGAVLMLFVPETKLRTSNRVASEDQEVVSAD
ncbi:MDR family MFS transporter [Kocuria sp.]|uniref:MDR family MFS transporter n=1 Tax=Kocuria sp. TaxID=1871328 RepID=UPI0026E0FC58|nr:MDR family MFS transporter [Kocuria sp.]MDO5618168.1 MDR family MFS transporter [Kocuria sp.]